MAFVERAIDLTFDLGASTLTGAQSTFGSTGATSVEVTGLRTSARISKSGGYTQSQLNLRVWGLTPSIMRQLSTLGQLYQLNGINQVTVKAGDKDSLAKAIVYMGGITSAWIDYSEAPNIGLQITAGSGALQAMAATDPTSVNGSADVAILMQGFATQMGLDFQNNGVTAILSFPYLKGSAFNQAVTAAIAADIEWAIDDRTLCIWSRGGSRTTKIIEVNKDTGLVLAPAFTKNGMFFRTLFNPEILYGGLVRVTSSSLASPVVMKVLQLDHELDAQVIGGGAWFSNVQAFLLDSAKVINP